MVGVDGGWLGGVDSGWLGATVEEEVVAESGFAIRRDKRRKKRILTFVGYAPVVVVVSPVEIEQIPTPVEVETGLSFNMFAPDVIVGETMAPITPDIGGPIRVINTTIPHVLVWSPEPVVIEHTTELAFMSFTPSVISAARPPLSINGYAPGVWTTYRVDRPEMDVIVDPEMDDEDAIIIASALKLIWGRRG